MAKNGQQYGQSGDKRNSGGLGQTLPAPGDYQPGAPGEAGGQSPEGEVVPFSLDEFAALTGGQQVEAGGGQFSGDDLEFESFMFDAGDTQGAQLEQQATEAHQVVPGAAEMAQPGSTGLPALAPTPTITGQGLPMPSFADAFVADKSVSQTPPAFESGPAHDTDALQAALANIEDLVSGEAVPVPTSLQAQVAAPMQYPSSVADWTDQMLASVDDFAAVLLALRAGKPAVAAVSDTAKPTTATERSHAAPPKMKAIKTPTESPTAKAPATPKVTAEAPTEMSGEPANQMIQALPAISSEWAAGPISSPQFPELPAIAAEHPGVSMNMDAGAGMFVGEAVSPPEVAQAHVAEAHLETTAEAAPVAEQPATIASEVPTKPVSQVQEQPQALDPMAQEQPGYTDDGLPPWLQEEAAASEAVASIETEIPADVQTFESLAEGTWLGDLAAPAAEATLGVDADASDEGTSLPGAPEGRLSGDDLEFEPFMFDEGATPALPALPNIAEFMPAVQEMEASIEPVQPEAQAVEIAGEEAPLPFWLQDEGPAEQEMQMEVEALTAFEPAQQAAPQVEVEAELAPPVMTSAPLLGEETDDTEEAEEDRDFTDLPPIEPFDFSALQQEEVEERLGFNTEELAGTLPQVHEPMMVTANLDVLADLLEKERSSGMLDLRSLNLGLGGTRPTAETPTAAHITTPSLADDNALPAWGADADNRGAALTTSFISPETVPTAEASENTGVADFEVAPFDITDFRLDAEERGTGNLNTGLLERRVVEDAQKIFTGTLFTKPDLEKFADWEAPDWMDDSGSPTDKVTESALEDNDTETSRFKGSTQDVEAIADTAWMGTSLPGEAVGQALAPDASEESQEDALAPLVAEGEFNIFRARVSRFKMGDQLGQANVTTGADSAVADDSTHASPRVEAEPSPSWEKARVPATPAMTASEPAGQEHPSTPEGVDALDVATRAEVARARGSAPLDHLAGFEALQEIVASRPEDHGARMALAVAYAEEGHTDHALHEYHRLIHHRGLPPSMLNIISDQLADLESEAGGMARFHKVRGDLMMKQGQYREAIEEYNKIK